MDHTPPESELSRRFDVLARARDGLAVDGTSNEATTRLRVIDTLLVDVLGWDRACIDAEHYCREEGFADYTLSSPGTKRVLAVVEAKRQGTWFVLPEHAYTSDPTGFALIASESPSAAAALRQAVGYATTLGASYVVITNGHQWILALTFVDSQPVERRSVLVFESLDAISLRFRDFLAALSPEALQANQPIKRLLEDRLPAAPTKLSASIIGYPEKASRNVISNEISYVLDLVWSSLERHEPSDAFLERCYVVPDPSQDALEMALAVVQGHRNRDELALPQSVPAGEMTGVIASGASDRPILVLGSVGHGKSTFLRYFRRVTAKEELGRYLQIEVDFLDRPDGASEIANHIYDAIENQLRERYDVELGEDHFVRGVLHSELTRFARSSRGRLYPSDSRDYRLAEIEYIESIQSDRHKYLARVFAHLRRGRRHSVALFLDNLDRRSEAIQEEAFLRASSMARDYDALVFICLRPGTYHRSRRAGVLDSIAPKTLVVSPPDASVMLRRRLEFATSVALGEIDDPNIGVGTESRGIGVRLPTAATVLACFKESFQRRRGLVKLFEAVANGSPREVLRYVRDVLTSMHLDTGKIARSFAENAYVVPDHEALRALLFGDFMQYNPATSRFVNLFDIEKADPKLHFLRFIILSHLQRVQRDEARRGFVNCPDLARRIGELPYTRGLIDRAIGFLIEKECLESSVVDDGSSDGDMEVRITALGRYHVNVLVRTFQYLDAVIVDIPLTDVATRHQVRHVTDIRERVARARSVLNYLSVCAKSLTGEDVMVEWADVERALREDIETVQERIEA